MGLEPLEFTDCLTDSPFFREKLHDHEKELECTSKAIKTLINDGKDLLNAARNLSKAQKTFSQNLTEFNFECIGLQQTDDERIIAGALKEFGQLIARIEDERDRMLATATEQFIKPLENFRKQHIGSVKEGKKTFDKQTTKFCQSLERYLNLKTKINDNTLQEADAQLEMERRGFFSASMKYVLLLQEVQERKKFEFVEILLGFMYSLLTFYHEGHEAAAEFKSYKRDLGYTLQKTRDNFECTRTQAEQLMLKMLEVRGAKPVDQAGTRQGCTRQGYLYLMEKKALGTTWTKHYCWYRKDNKEFDMIPYSQSTGKLTQAVPEKMFLTSCVRRASDSIEKRFCFDLTVQDKPGPYTFQALSEEDRKLWMDAMDGKEPVYQTPSKVTDDTLLDDVGFTFVKKCIKSIEQRGLNDEGLYRLVGVNSKVNKLTSMGLDRRKTDKLALDEDGGYEVKTITSAVKNYLRSLPEPLMTFSLHSKFIAAAKQEAKTLRRHDIHSLVHQLPEANFEMLDLLIGHLKRVSANSEKNLMPVANLGVCFGPTLMRPEEETVAAIMDIKFCNIVVELLINHYEQIFKSLPEDADVTTEMRVVPGRHRINSNSSSSSAPLANFKNPIRSTPINNHHPASVFKNPVSYHPYSGPPQSPGPGGYSNFQVPAYAQARAKLRPVAVFNPNTMGFETQAPESSASDSSESLNSSVSNHVSISTSSPKLDPSRRTNHNSPALFNNPGYATNNAIANRLGLNLVQGSDVPTLVTSVPSLSSNLSSSMTGSMTGSLASTAPGPRKKKKTVRTLYRCLAENDNELSFEPNQLIHEVKESKEPGWLEGMLNGRRGLIPSNYVEYLD